MKLNRSSRLGCSMLAGLTLASPVLAFGGSITFGGENLTIVVDEQVCATAPVQCTDLGGTADPAGPTNANAVALHVQALGPGFSPILGLSDTDFEIDVQFPPAGGSTVVLGACASCFGATFDGTYLLFVEPTAATWQSGTYSIQVRVDAGPLVLRALGRIDIPFP